MDGDIDVLGGLVLDGKYVLILLCWVGALLDDDVQTCFLDTKTV